MTALLKIWLYAPFAISGVIALGIGGLFFYGFSVDGFSITTLVLTVIVSVISFLIVHWPVGMIFNFLEDFADMFRRSDTP